MDKTQKTQQTTSDNGENPSVTPMTSRVSDRIDDIRKRIDEALRRLHDDPDKVTAVREFIVALETLLNIVTSFTPTHVDDMISKILIGALKTITK